MLFNSNSFILLFLPVFILGYWIATRLEHRTPEKAWIVFGSLFFYSWWNPKYLPLIVGSILINYFICNLILKFNHVFLINKSRMLLSLGIALNLAVLGYYRYTDFLIDYTNQIFNSDMPFLEVILPLAISFFTFQQIAYLIESYKGNIPRQSLLTYASFVTFFPQLIAGPIVYHSELIPNLTNKRNQFPDFDYLSRGLIVFAMGLAMKVVVADTLSLFADYGFSNIQQLSIQAAWLATTSFSLQIYFDFAGYSTMAIGLALLVGIKLPVNFDRPYLSTDIQEFWRRWHITLGRFFRDYLYIPLGGNRFGIGRTSMNIMIVFILGGLWHGAALNFVVWGLLIGIGIAVQGLIRNIGVKINRWIAWVTTLLFMNIVWVFFRATTLPKGVEMLKTMFGLGTNQVNLTGYSPEGLLNLLSFNSGSILIGPTIFLIFAFGLALTVDTTWKAISKKSLNVKTLLVTVGLFIISILIMNWGDSREFIYFNF